MTSRHPHYCGHPHCRGHPPAWERESRMQLLPMASSPDVCLLCGHHEDPRLGGAHHNPQPGEGVMVMRCGKGQNGKHCVWCTCQCSFARRRWSQTPAPPPSVRRRTPKKLCRTLNPTRTLTKRGRTAQLPAVGVRGVDRRTRGRAFRTILLPGLHKTSPATSIH